MSVGCERMCRSVKTQSVEIAPIFNYIEFTFIDCVGSISSTLAAFQFDVVRETGVKPVKYSEYLCMKNMLRLKSV